MDAINHYHQLDMKESKILYFIFNLIYHQKVSKEIIYKESNYLITY